MEKGLINGIDAVPRPHKKCDAIAKILNDEAGDDKYETNRLFCADTRQEIIDFKIGETGSSKGKHWNSYKTCKEWTARNQNRVPVTGDRPGLPGLWGGKVHIGG